MHKTVTRAGACLLALLAAVGLPSCGKAEKTVRNEAGQNAAPTVEQAVYTAKPGRVSKTETVYVNLQSDGTPQSISVSDWIHTDVGQVCVNDISDLRHIQNVKNDIQPLVNGENLQWHMPETDIYYSGQTNKMPPVQPAIRYYLNGKIMSAEQMAGQSGRVKIEVDFKNTFSETVKKNGKKTKLYLPVMVVGGMLLEESAFQSITVENGRSIGDGSKQIVLFFGMPGMAESLGLSGSDIGEWGKTLMASTASVTAVTENFTMGNMYFAAIPLSSLGLGEFSQTAADLESILSLLQTMQRAVAELKSDTVLSVLQADSGSVHSLLNTVSDAMALYQNNKALLDVMSRYLSGENGRQLARLLELLGSDETGALLSFLAEYDIVKLIDGMEAMHEAVPLVNALSEALNTPAVRQALDALPETLEQLEAIRTDLEENQALIDSLSALSDSDRIASLSALADSVGQANLTHFAGVYAGLGANADDLGKKISAWMAFGQSYRLFTKAPAEAETAVTFVYMTPSIQKTAVP